MSSIESLQSIAHEISSGFETLLEQLDAQKRLEIDLREQLARAANRFNSNDSDDPSDGAFSAWQDEIVKQISGDSIKPDLQYTRQSDQDLSRLRDAIEKLKAVMSPTPPARKCPVSHKSTAVDGEVTTSMHRKCPVRRKSSQPNFEHLEQDFTTQGKPSSLECPFAAMTKQGPLDNLGARDPIAAEFHPDILSAQSLDEARACNKCPIRFLDKHSPEEIAQYFEKHKHELPRSHEICVKRYQQNENSIRQLDAKYGNLVSMIQGLGNKHKQYLPSDEQAAMSANDQKSTAAVEKWADNVDHEGDMAGGDAEPEPRVSHFERSLRDVRLGESPTRPWGIHIPTDRQQPESAAVSTKPSEPPSLKVESERSPSQPMAEAAIPAGAASARARSQASSRHSRNRQPNQIIFNGPVFLGYSPEQAALFLQQLGASKLGEN